MSKSLRGFTIVELLIVIVVIAILAAISVVAYTGIQNRAHDATLASTVSQLQKSIELYKAQHGQYPQTQTNSLQTNSSSQPYVDSNCRNGGTITANWIPGITQQLPQSNTSHRGAMLPSSTTRDYGCYAYISDGTTYILSAWNLRKSPSTDNGYRRAGFRETHNTQNYLCNHTNLGGRASGSYIAEQDYYKYSYTYSNITGCNETPPAGA